MAVYHARYITGIDVSERRQKKIWVKRRRRGILESRISSSGELHVIYLSILNFFWSQVAARDSSFRIA